MGNKAVSDEDLRAELERLRQENAALKKGGAASGVRMHVSEKERFLFMAWAGSL
jgi:hypothetical protein